MEKNRFIGLRKGKKRVSLIKLEYFDLHDCSIPYSITGSGQYVFFFHGFPTSSRTWRFIVPELSKCYTIISMDLPGLGDSKFNKLTNLDMREQAARLAVFIKSFACTSFSIVAHDSGGAIARLVALHMREQTKNLILINTEIPYHRPPWIPLYQRLTRVPYSSRVIKKLLGFKRYNESNLAFGQLYHSKRHFLNGNLDLHVSILKRSLEQVNGAIGFLQGIDWTVIDLFEHAHKNIDARVLLLWGTNDKTFPLERAKKMKSQFKDAVIYPIHESRLLPHEEQPKECVNAIIQFLNK